MAITASFETSVEVISKAFDGSKVLGDGKDVAVGYFDATEGNCETLLCWKVLERAVEGVLDIIERSKPST